MTLEPTNDEVAALDRYLRQKLDDGRFPLAPLKAILAKLEPPAPRPELPPPLKPSMGPSIDAEAEEIERISDV